MNQDKQLEDLLLILSHLMRDDKECQNFGEASDNMIKYAKKILDQFQNPPPIKCTCERTGETEMLVMCCNICGKPDYGAIGRIGEAEIKLPKLSDELIDFLELKLESEKASFENYEVTAPDDVFEDPEVKELYHKDMLIVKDLTKLINYIKQQSK